MTSVQQRPAPAPAQPRFAACSPERLKVRRGRDVLEDVVAAVLEDLGFRVSVDHTFTTKAGTSIEVDVWGEKAIGDLKFYVYASCKNLDRPVDVNVVREEGGRVSVMPNIPHVRILVVSEIKDTAKKEALANGFVVVEVGRKVDESNAEDACRLIYNRLNAVFVGMAPAWLQELANLADELRDSLQELASVDNRLRSVADKLVGLLQRSAH